MRDQASDMLNTIGDITSRESSPTKNMDEGEDNRSIRMRAGHLAMINLQGAMVHDALWQELQTCSGYSSGAIVS